MKNYVPSNEHDVSFIKNVKLFGTRFLVQRGIVAKTDKNKPDVVILLGVNPLILSSLYSALYFSVIKRAKVYWWGHGTLGRQGRLGVLFRKLFYTLSDGVLVYSEGGKQNLVAKGVLPEKIHVVNNCLNDEDYGFDRPIVSGDKFKILFSGRLTAAKRVEELIKLGDRLKKDAVNFQIDILGDGPMFEDLKAEVEASDLEKFVFLQGPQYGREAHRFFNEATVFVHPGAIGLSVIHALSFGLPVITSNTNDRNKPEMEALLDGVNGSFYSAGEIEELVLKTLEWKNRVEEDRSGVIRICQNSITEYTPSAVANKIVAAIVK